MKADLPDCDHGVFYKGQSVCLLDIPKETAEYLCKSLSQTTGLRFDWHYIGGRVHIKFEDKATSISN